MGKVNFSKMAKSKNHSSHNQGHKNHAQGIFKVKKERYTSNKMVNQKLIRNTRRSKKFDPSVKKNVTTTKRIAARRMIKQQVVTRIKDIKNKKILSKAAPAKKEVKKDAKKVA